MNQTIDLKTRRPPVKTNRRTDYDDGGVSLYFEEEPRIGNRSDALSLLDDIAAASYIQGLPLALAALRDAIDREVV
jgi:hypothetical protein